MKDRLVYIELKSGFSDDGPAWIAIAGASKSGATLYSNGKAFKSLKGSGIGANFYDIETGEEYWISGVKKSNQDRHRFGRGGISIDRPAIAAYLAATGFSSLPSNLVPEDLKPAEQLEAHDELEHRSRDERLQDYSYDIPRSRSDAIKRRL
jgi:hypothetical protein